MPHYERHIFVCVNRLDDDSKDCCATRGGQEVRDAFKRAVKEHGLKSQVRANNAGCLDQCKFGVAVVIYPEQVWYAAVTPADAEEIVTEHVMGGQPVQRLLMPRQPEILALPRIEPGKSRS